MRPKWKWLDDGLQKEALEVPGIGLQTLRKWRTGGIELVVPELPEALLDPLLGKVNKEPVFLRDGLFFSPETLLLSRLEAFSTTQKGFVCYAICFSCCYNVGFLEDAKTWGKAGWNRVWRLQTRCWERPVCVGSDKAKLANTPIVKWQWNVDKGPWMYDYLEDNIRLQDVLDFGMKDYDE